MSARSNPMGVCPVCGGIRRVKKDGTMAVHGSRNDKGYVVMRRCPGIDHPPTEMMRDAIQEREATQVDVGEQTQDGS